MTIEVSDQWFQKLRNGSKVVEGKKANKRWVEIAQGKSIRFVNSDHKEQEFTVAGGNNRIYTKEDAADMSKLIGKECDVLDMFLLCEGWKNRVLPGVGTFEEARNVYLSPPVSWTLEEIKNDGIIAIYTR